MGRSRRLTIHVIPGRLTVHDTVSELKRSLITYL
jgi:hypothetical protein